MPLQQTDDPQTRAQRLQRARWSALRSAAEEALRDYGLTSEERASLTSAALMADQRVEAATRALADYQSQQRTPQRKV